MLLDGSAFSVTNTAAPASTGFNKMWSSLAYSISVDGADSECVFDIDNASARTIELDGVSGIVHSLMLDDGSHAGVRLAWFGIGVWPP